MTKSQALKEAVKRWGSKAIVRDDFQVLRYRYSVADLIAVRGYGDSWEEAFAFADRLWGKDA